MHDQPIYGYGLCECGCGQPTSIAKTTGVTSKVSPEDVRAIRASDLTQDALASKYGVRQQTISAIKRGRTWADLT